MATETTPAESISPFQAYLDTLHSEDANLHSTIQAISDLVPHLTTSISPIGTRLIAVTHPSTSNINLSGTAILDTLGSLYLSAARRCTETHASFATRLLHNSLEQAMEDLYVASEDQLDAGLKDGSVKFPPPDPNVVQGCACCRGDPDATILSGFHTGEALFYDEPEYKQIFGDEKSCGSLRGANRSWLMASSEQVKRKKEEEGGLESKL
ncbi:uncharacterized protein BDV14DRAFT_182759 [Aspergillus stella-maris]|uniref:uncharacterized protein n=1 Tax=Aspergillus stella-maris TaxID=1810926 RepID=UPI003CCCBD22